MFDFLLILIEFIIVFGLMLFVHEMGHFLMCRLFKVEVEEFGFGLPPRAARLFTWQGTEFTINWLPFGAFVRPKGENDPEVGGLASASPWVRLGVLLGGPVANLMVGVILFAVMFMSAGRSDPSVIMFQDIVADSPAAAAGLKAGDVVLQVNGQPITNIEDFRTIIRANANAPVSLIYKRDEVTSTISITPTLSTEGKGQVGVYLGTGFRPVSFFEAVPLAFQTAYEQCRELFLVPGRLISGTINPEEARMVGVVGIFDIYSQVNKMDAEAAAAPAPRPQIFRLSFIAAISIALGLTNLFPIPPLDGGRILFVLPEIIFRKRIPTRFENLANSLSFIALLILMVLITFNDIVNPIVLP